MNIGYVKKEECKKGDNYVCNVLNLLKYYTHRIINKVWKDKINQNIFYTNNLNEKSIKKLKTLLEKNNIDYVVTQGDIDINYKTLNGNIIIKYLLPEIIKDILEKTKPKTEQIAICVNKYSDENIKIIEDIARNTKSLNVVTNNEWFDQLENKLEKEEIYISVTNNTRTALKSSSILINVDYDDLDKFNINRNSIIIDLSNKLVIPKGFNGIIIRSIGVHTNKVIRKIEEFISFNKSKLIEAEILKNNNYTKARDFIKINKIQIEKYKNKRVIDNNEFKRIRKLNDNIVNKKLNKSDDLDN